MDEAEDDDDETDGDCAVAGVVVVLVVVVSAVTDVVVVVIAAGVVLETSSLVLDLDSSSPPFVVASGAGVSVVGVTAGVSESAVVGVCSFVDLFSDVSPVVVVVVAGVVTEVDDLV